MSNIKLIISELYKAFHYFNKEYYNNTLPEPSILVQNRGNKKNVLGWCTCSKVWRDSQGDEKRYEIALISEYLNLGMYPIMSTLLHEMAHLHNLVNDIKDVTRNGTYHNKAFKETAESHGLIVEHDKSIGWSITRLEQNTIKFINTTDLNEKIFTLSRIDFDEIMNETDEDSDNEQKTKTSSRKYICPKCGTIVRATKEVNIQCTDCNMKFVLENK